MRNRLRLLGFICLLGATLAGSAQAQETAKQQDIRRLLKMTGSGELGTQVMVQMLNNMKKSLPNVPESFWTDFVKEVHTEELVDLIMPIYDRNLSAEDVRELIKFYDSPTGKRFVAVLPKITQESMTVGENWGRQLAEKVVERLQKSEQKQRPQLQTQPKKTTSP